MAATAFLPYTIGKTDIASVEEFNVKIDSGIVIGITELLSVSTTNRISSKAVIGKTILSDYQLFDSIDENSVTAETLIIAEDFRLFEEEADTIVGIAEIQSDEPFSEHISCSAEVADAELGLSVPLSASIETYSLYGYNGRLFVRHYYPGRYRDRGYVVNQPAPTGSDFFGYEITATTIPNILCRTDTDFSGNTVISASMSHDNAVRAGITSGATINADLIFNHNPVLYTDENIVYGRMTLTFDAVRNYVVNGVAYIERPIFDVIGVGIPSLVNEPIIKFSSYAYAIESYHPDFFGANLINAGAIITDAPPSTDPPNLIVDHTLAGVILAGASIKLRPDFNNDRSRYGGDGYPPGEYNVGIYWAPRGSEPDTDIGGGNYDRTLGGYSIGQGTIIGGLVVA